MNFKQRLLKELIFCSLSSGSSGNCYYLGNGFGSILIDAGISATVTRKFLKDIGVSIQDIKGVLISHNHTDHIRGLEVLTRKNHLPAYTTVNIWKSIFDRGINISRDCIRNIQKEERFSLAGFDIEIYPVSHDAPETIGFHICSGGKSITIATDLGYISKTAAGYIKKANLLIIESNYDEQMLLDGNYPYSLKTRIKSDHGHLGNHQTSEFLADNISGKLSHICLAHLSKNNNNPQKALQALKQTFSDKEVSLKGKYITVLNRNNPSEIIDLANQSTLRVSSKSL
ncbi:MAG TPA: MBL fold metallo-hydrolase [Bacteroidales bacterium]|mgnify:CR=1 FL=1|nr:MBL fold metallo-hydrolase [Bacteroidales bacterium]